MKPADVLAAVRADGFTACLSDDRDGDGTLLSWIAHDRRLHAYFSRKDNVWMYWTLRNFALVLGPNVIGDPVPELRAALETLVKEPR